jgi:hemerythrin
MLIDWSDEYLIGIDKIDEQHKEFFAKVHRVYEACLESEGENVVQETLDFLKNYAIEHFRSEEAFMREYEYPDVEEHSKLHAEFLDEYTKLSDEFSDLGTSQVLADNIVDTVQNWLIEHIADADRYYATHVKSRS